MVLQWLISLVAKSRRKIEWLEPAKSSIKFADVPIFTRNRRKISNQTAENNLKNIKDHRQLGLESSGVTMDETGAQEAQGIADKMP